jgi:ABC-type Na+ efflux pump permease subunit
MAVIATKQAEYISPPKIKITLSSSYLLPIYFPFTLVFYFLLLYTQHMHIKWRPWSRQPLTLFPRANWTIPKSTTPAIPPSLVTTMVSAAPLLHPYQAPAKHMPGPIYPNGMLDPNATTPVDKNSAVIKQRVSKVHRGM